ncbi:hypothetical protein, partial [Salmonella sp. SAL4443]|uniref:hypothetical protein n=1 Tax=Salmonella sp. SAL4443 TaxID=3159898 RepID=UPI00397D7412
MHFIFISYQILASWINWMNAFALPRPLSNSIEAALVPAALYYWPWPGFRTSAHWTVREKRYVENFTLSRPACRIDWLL